MENRFDNIEVQLTDFEGTEVYKVVEKGTRLSTNWAIYSCIYQFYRSEQLERNREDFLYNQLIFEYKKNSTITARKDTLGVLCFNNIINAISFIQQRCEIRASLDLDIIKVKGIGKPTSIPYVLKSCGIDPTLVNMINSKELMKFNINNPELTKSRRRMVIHSYIGTISYPEVKVLT